MKAHIYIYVYIKVSADSRVPSRLFSSVTLAILSRCWWAVDRGRCGFFAAAYLLIYLDKSVFFLFNIWDFVIFPKVFSLGRVHLVHCLKPDQSIIWHL